MANQITLFQLNVLIRQALDKELQPSYWVIAEIGEIKLAQKGHCYLELVEKEEDNICAKIKANIWAYTYRNICGWFESITGKSLEPGMKILAQVAVSFHEVYGISLNIKDIDPHYTLGERARKRQQIINKLKEDGVFDMNRELQLPLVPQRIAVVSSPSAAGYEDFMVHLKKNPFNYKFQITFFKALMQGSEAKASIIQTLLMIYKDIDEFDLVLIIRGGGAQVDLDCFDAYDLASHVAQFPLPIITGIGHERDETIVDLVAHTKMKTPTAVAEFLIRGLRSFEEKLNLVLNKLHNKSGSYVKEQNYKLNELTQKLKFTSKNHLMRNKHQIDQLQSDLNYLCISTTKSYENKLSSLYERLFAGSKNMMRNEQAKLRSLVNSIKLLNPENILKRGYSITKINNININKIKEIKEGDIITTITVNHTLKSTVDIIKKNKDN